MGGLGAEDLGAEDLGAEDRLILAFAQVLPVGSMLIRVGVGCDRAPKPWDYMMVLLPESFDFELIGLTKNPEEIVGDFTRSHYLAIKKVVEDDLGVKDWKFRRFNHEKEKLFMTKKNFPTASAHATHKGRDGNNEINQEATDKMIIGLVQGRTAAGLVYTKIETQEIGAAGQKRKVRAVIELEMK